MSSSTRSELGSTSMLQKWDQWGSERKYNTNCNHSKNQRHLKGNQRPRAKPEEICRKASVTEADFSLLWYFDIIAHKMMSEIGYFLKKSSFICPSSNSCHDQNSALYLLWFQNSFQLTVWISAQKCSPLHTRAVAAIGVPSLMYLPEAGKKSGFDTSIFLLSISHKKEVTLIQKTLFGNVFLLIQ